MGITNELFQTERNESSTCQFLAIRKSDINMDGVPAIDSIRRYLNPLGHRYPLDAAELRERAIAFAARNPPGHYLTNTDGQSPIDTISSIEKFASFMRYLAPPTPSPDTPGGAESISRGRDLFGNVGCAACHTPTLRTGNATVGALRSQPVNLYSDLLLHDMGPGLADGVAQGQAAPREFRTAPLWGLGQRIYFLHDGRTRDLLIAIEAHRSGSSPNRDASEANTVVGQFEALPQSGKQDILNFLRSL
jgi:mono/diheme cytochrome c family protein